MKAAYTGVAASVIDGKTTHTICSISASSSHFDGSEGVGDETRKKLETIWENCQYLAIDEMSMISKDFLALLSRNIGIGKRNQENVSFGGVNIILLGDFHQFPPVARPISDALFYPINAEKDRISSQIGRCIYEEFAMVVILKKQLCTVDPVWYTFLQHLHKGAIDDNDLAMLSFLILGRKKEQGTPDFDIPPWDEATLITPRHAVRTQWNDAATTKLCQQRRQPLFICM